MPPKQKSSDSTPQNKRKNHSLAAEWTVKDIELLIDSLHELRRTHSTDDNSASFKPQAWHIIALPLEESRTKGGVKNARSCKDKWKAVSVMFSRIESLLNVQCSSRPRSKPVEDYRMSLASAGAHITAASP